MRIIVDADACPSISLIEDLAKKYKVKTILVADNTHNLESDYSDIIIVDKFSNSADFKIIDIAIEDDIIVTQDYGLAILGLSKKTKVISPNGLIYDNSNIDMLLDIKYINSKIRKQKCHIKGPKKRTNNDDIRLINNLEKLIRR